MPFFPLRRSLDNIAQLVEGYGQDVSDIASTVGMGLSEAELRDAASDPVILNDFLEEAAKVCNQRFLGIEFAKLHGWGLISSAWMLTLGSGTVGEALQLLADHLQQQSSFTTALLEITPNGAAYCFEVRGVPASRPVIHRSRVQATELGLARTCLELREVLGERWMPSHCQFRHAEPLNLEPLQRMFGNELSFNQDVSAICITQADLDAPLPQLQAAERQRLQAALESSGEALALRVERVIRFMMNTDRCTLERVASMMKSNPRTLQHQLKQDGTSYQSLYDAVREDLAKYYTSHSQLSIAAITERLHFTDTAAFSRFFRGRIGMSPSKYRNHTPASLS
ncbi:AraC family transcriptional regulator [Pseudohalioglobus lutimaris]|uniref:HTH araC/xylS-type domain-containing protein n=1 Tax=Pseudohalioglobus lutimaris TaxID=1737061 RepID=A0A2N5WYB8_9GAMM|nr:AraC family transcriptional regulator [Pseudohalioglobus lutimaris]PLW67220.1 hypothetical protein C0039_17980 [Pseudohalioglobus lutimaris]